ncbi:CDP-glycerol glycerophosphotransferase family protein [Bacillus pumilus]|uniref:CDP-glycerol glycerophosphotransferase family protein n=1 Tax=Bacillus pumilus TaxID=1408 RepID=UPI00203A9B76|nr:CDP-glycerol glycerophosphotransferase family protein [Bacillus pumilus]MCM3035928.1 CDP-glycerol glycerophosphotransferase family protein [Bacillus pumilus]
MIEITLVIPLDSPDKNRLQTYVDSIKQQTIKFEKLEVFFVIENKMNLTLEDNIYLISRDIFDLSKAKGKFIFLSNIEYRFEPSLLEDMQNKFKVNKEGIFKANANLNNKFEQIMAATFLLKEKLISLENFNEKYFSTNSLAQFFFEIHTQQIVTESVGKSFIDEKSLEYNYQRNVKVINFIVDRSNNQILETHGQFILEELISVVDTNVFLNNLLENDHMNAYDAIKKIIQYIEIKDIYDFNEVGYGTFLRLIETNNYYEATEFMKLFKSRRFWFNQTKKYKSYFTRVPFFGDSLSWKLTKPLRLSKKYLSHVGQVMKKYSLITFAALNKILIRKNIWLVGERFDQAEDNGFAFFEYCRLHHPEEKIYYIIDKNSPHATKVEKLGNIIYHGTFKHKLFAILADIYISAWTFQEGLHPWTKKIYNKYYKKLLSSKFNVCLQHGVIMHNISPYLHKKNYNQDLIICSAESEKEIILSTLGYSREQVVVTGISRFDKLLERKPVKKQILIMPTWRRSLVKMNKHNFMKSTYFLTYQNLIQNDLFQKTIEENEIEVKVYVHYQMQKYIDSFNVDHPQIEILTKENAVVSDLIKESSMLITDYSSVSADFFFMNKPVIFYQFDSYDNHSVRVNEINAEDIGIVALEEHLVVSNTVEIVNRNYKNEYKYEKNSKTFFKYKDGYNNKRIYEAIQTAFRNNKT